MALLDDIIEAGVDSKFSLSTLLRKCLLLAHELKSDRLKSWSNQELNGYSEISSLPDYRIMSTRAKGHFGGSFGASLNNYPIPSLVLDKRHRDFAEKVYLMDAISGYESAVHGQNGSLKFEWPADLCLYYQSKLIPRYGLISAYQSVSSASIVAMLDTIRNRTLNMALEIKGEIGDSADISQISSAEAKKSKRDHHSKHLQWPSVLYVWGSPRNSRD
jgi:hypothetical protein